MPLYEFSCNECKKDFESIMRPNDPVECPHCKMNNATKLISKPGVYHISGDNSASTRPGKAWK